MTDRKAGTRACYHISSQECMIALAAASDRQPGNGAIIMSAGPAPHIGVAAAMPETVVKPRSKAKPKVERPKLYKVILVNDDFTPREFVVRVLQGEFRMTEDQAHKVIAETKATRATDAGRAKGYPLLFTTEPEE
jgi:ATP-dependent Clp protease adaptor protein ClpS